MHHRKTVFSYFGSFYTCFKQKLFHHHQTLRRLNNEYLNLNAWRASPSTRWKVLWKVLLRESGDISQNLSERWQNNLLFRSPKLRKKIIFTHFCYIDRYKNVRGTMWTNVRLTYKMRAKTQSALKKIIERHNRLMLTLSAVRSSWRFEIRFNMKSGVLFRSFQEQVPVLFPRTSAGSLGYDAGRTTCDSDIAICLKQMKEKRDKE